MLCNLEKCKLSCVISIEQYGIFLCLTFKMYTIHEYDTAQNQRPKHNGPSMACLHWKTMESQCSGKQNMFFLNNL